MAAILLGSLISMQLLRVQDNLRFAFATDTPGLRAFLNATTDLAPTTLARRQAPLRSCLAWACRNEYLAVDSTGKLEPVRVPQRDPRPLIEAQVEAILTAIPAGEKRNRLFFTLLYETGMRAGEALSIHVQHVTLNQVDGGYIRFFGKGDKERIVPFVHPAP